MTKGWYFGYKSFENKGCKRTEVQGAEIQQVSAVRAFSRVPAEVWYVQDMFQDASTRRENSRGEESQLVMKQNGLSFSCSFISLLMAAISPAFNGTLLRRILLTT